MTAAAIAQLASKDAIFEGRDVVVDDKIAEGLTQIVRGGLAMFPVLDDARSVLGFIMLREIAAARAPAAPSRDRSVARIGTFVRRIGRWLFEAGRAHVTIRDRSGLSIGSVSVLDVLKTRGTIA